MTHIIVPSQTGGMAGVMTEEVVVLVDGALVPAEEYMGRNGHG